MKCKIDDVLKEYLGKNVDHRKVTAAIAAVKGKYGNKDNLMPRDHSYFLKPTNGAKDGVDIYSTPVNSMKRSIEIALRATQNSNADSSNKYERQLAKSKDIAALYEMFGPDKGNNKLWRSMMKPLVMVYIYGAQITSIRKKAGVQFGMFAIDEAIKLFGDKTMGEVIAISKDNNDANSKAASLLLKVINTVASKSGLKFRVFDPNMNIDVDYTGNPMNARIKDIYLDEEVVGKMMEPVIGDSIEKSFKDSFGFIDDYRSSIKNVEMVNYLLFKFELRKKLAKYVRDDGTLMVNKDIMDKAFRELDEEGKFVGAINSRGGIQDYKKFDQKDRGRSGITGRMADGRLSPITKTVTVKGKNVIANPGAVGVTAIHDMDGYLMNLSNNDDFQNIFDAYIAGLDLDKAREISDTYNFNVIDLSRNHSILHNAVEKVSGQLADMSKDELAEFMDSISGEEAEIMKEAYGVIDNDFNQKSIDKVNETLRKIDAERDKNINGDVTVGHMHVSSSFPPIEVTEHTEVGGKKVSMSNKKFADTHLISKVLSKIADVVNSPDSINIWSTDNSKFSALSNFKSGAITVNGVRFNSVEALFQYSKAKFFNDEKAMKRILEAKDGANARAEGSKVKGYDDVAWNKVSTEKMRKSIELMFKQNPKSLDLLLSTGTARLTHNGNHVDKWTKEFPRILMEIRDKEANKRIGIDAIKSQKEIEKTTPNLSAGKESSGILADIIKEFKECS